VLAGILGLACGDFGAHYENQLIARAKEIYGYRTTYDNHSTMPQRYRKRDPKFDAILESAEKEFQENYDSTSSIRDLSTIAIFGGLGVLLSGFICLGVKELEDLAESGK